MKVHRASGPGAGVTVRLIGLSLCLIIAHAMTAHASPAGGLSAEIIQVLPVSEKDLLVLTREKRGVFTSQDGGRRWNQPSGLPDAFVYSAAKAWGEVLLLTSAGVYSSRDGGTDWRPAAKVNAAFLACSPDHSSCLLKVWGKGLYQVQPAFFSKKEHEDPSKPGEEVPSAPLTVGLPDTAVQSIAYGRDNTIFAGFLGKGVFLSQNSGKSWQEINGGLANKDVLVLAANPQGSIFAGTYGGGLFRWSWENSTWSLVETPLVDGIVQCVTFGADGLMLVGTRGEGVILSRDDGRTWPEAGGGVAGANIHGLAATPDGVLWAGAYGSGLFVSRDGGWTWAPRPFAYLSHVYALATASDRAWYAAVKGVGLLRSTDEGKNWAALPMPFPLDEEISLAADRHHRVFAGTRTGGVFVSSDGGRTWGKTMAGLPGEGVHSLRDSPEGELFAAAADGSGLYRLGANDTWEKIVAEGEFGEQYAVWDMMFLPSGEAVAYGLQDLLVSQGGFGSWRLTHMAQNFSDLWVDSTGRLWTERFLSIFAQTGDGRGWDEMTEIPDDRYQSFRELGPAQFAAVRMEGGVDVLRWTGSGLQRVMRGLADQSILALATDGNRTVLAGTERGLWVSRDQGETWREVDLQP